MLAFVWGPVAQFTVEMTGRGKLNVSGCAIFLTIIAIFLLTFHQSKVLNNKQLSDHLYLDNSDSDVIKNLQRTFLKGPEMLKELKGNSERADYYNNSIKYFSENDQFPEVEPDECVRTTEGNISDGSLC